MFYLIFSAISSRKMTQANLMHETSWKELKLKREQEIKNEKNKHMICQLQTDNRGANIRELNGEFRFSILFSADHLENCLRMKDKT